MARTVVTYKGMKVVLPKGARTLTAAHKAIIDRSKVPSAKSGCRGVFFNQKTFAVRCDRNRGNGKAGGMSRAAKRRFQAQRRRGEIFNCARRDGTFRFSTKSCKRKKRK